MIYRNEGIIGDIWEKIKAFFKWVSASISVGSQKVESSKKEVIGLEDLPPPPPEVNVVL